MGKIRLTMFTGHRGETNSIPDGVETAEDGQDKPAVLHAKLPKAM